ncbi:hypothetical protein LJK87_24655 [Paenibacillus sp. P25]|nr:hypothetical protein LJK87_24655 [Paenibacillus sp. P25]
MLGIFQTWLGDVKKFKYNSRYFRKSLTMMLLIASIPGLIIGISIYWVASNNLETELQRLHQNQIQQACGKYRRPAGLSGAHFLPLGFRSQIRREAEICGH